MYRPLQSLLCFKNFDFRPGSGLVVGDEGAVPAADDGDVIILQNALFDEEIIQRGIEIQVVHPAAGLHVNTVANPDGAGDRPGWLWV